MEGLPEVLSIQLRRGGGWQPESVVEDQYDHFTVYSSEMQFILVFEEDRFQEDGRREFVHHQRLDEKAAEVTCSYLDDLVDGGTFDDAIEENYRGSTSGSFEQRFSQKFPDREDLPERYRDEIQDIADRYLRPRFEE